ncbi:MAG: hypothetical protein ACXWDL_13325 [Nocardioides sp.]
METSEIVWIIVAVVVVLALIGLAVSMSRKRQAAKATQNRQHAEGLRQEARAQQGGVQQEELKAREAELEADRKRLEAERAEAEAERAKQSHLQEHARIEDQVREADRVDPDVDHRSPDYAPETARPTDTAGTTGSHTPGTEDPAHQTSPEEPSSGTHRA